MEMKLMIMIMIMMMMIPLCDQASVKDKIGPIVCVNFVF